MTTLLSRLSGPLADFARIKTSLDPATDAQFRIACREGRREKQDHYCYDALLDLITEDHEPVADTVAKPGQAIRCVPIRVVDHLLDFNSITADQYVIVDHQH